MCLVATIESMLSRADRYTKRYQTDRLFLRLFSRSRPYSVARVTDMLPFMFNVLTIDFANDHDDLVCTGNSRRPLMRFASSGQPTKVSSAMHISLAPQVVVPCFGPQMALSGCDSWRPRAIVLCLVNVPDSFPLHRALPVDRTRIVG